MEQAVSNTDVLYAGSATAGVWKSIDKGLNWILLTKDMLVNGVIAVEIDHTNENVVYFEGGGILYKTINDRFYSSISLLVELLSFTATLQEKKEILLEWKTISEINSDYFNVERSKDSINFEWIGKVTAAGNSSEEQ